MEQVLTVKAVMEEYGFSRQKTDELFDRCKQIPRKPRGKKMVLRSEFEKVLTGGKK